MLKYINYALIRTMFDPKLTIESGIARVGKIRGLRQLNILPNDEIYETVQEFRKLMQILYENEVLRIDFIKSTVEILKPEFKHYVNDLDFVVEDILSVLYGPYIKRALINGTYIQRSQTLEEAFMNAIEYGGDRLSVRHLFGNNGHFYVFEQSKCGPNLEEARQTYLRDGSFLYTVGKCKRGHGLKNFAYNESSVWYANLDPGYATLIYEKLSVNNQLAYSGNY